MPLHVILNDLPRGAYCRVCRNTIRGTEHAVARHMTACAEAHHAKTQEQRAKLAFLDCQDPELQAHLEREFRAGRLKLDTKRVS